MSGITNIYPSPRLFSSPDGHVYILSYGASKPEECVDGPERVVPDGTCTINLLGQGMQDRPSVEVPVDSVRKGVRSSVFVNAATATALRDLMPNLKFVRRTEPKDVARHAELALLEGLVPTDDIASLSKKVRDQGGVASNWGTEDLAFIEEDGGTDALTDGQLEGLKAKFLLTVRKQLEERLGAVGNEVLDTLWAKHRTELIDAAKAMPADQPTGQPRVSPATSDYEVDIRICVTADSFEQAAGFAIDDIRATSLGPWNVTVRNLGSGQEMPVECAHNTQEHDFNPRPN